MCENCAKHGDGKKWYLRAKNYSDDLASDIRRRRTAIKWFDYFKFKLADDLDRLEQVYPKVPNPLRPLIGSLVTIRQRREHFGQVVPIEDIGKILSIVSSVVRVPCACRRVTLGREVRYCLGISITPENNMVNIINPSHWEGPDTSGMDTLTTSEAYDFMKGLEEDGAVHSIWTFNTPFIGRICNCDRSDCVAMRARVKHGIKVMYKGEYIDQSKCYGCGVCRADCGSKAISLVDRSSIPLFARDW